MAIAETLDRKLTATYAPTHLEITDESHMHSSGKGAESHFKVLMVSEKFQGLNKVARQRDVYTTLAPEMKAIHALSLRLLTAEEWAKDETNFESPLCASRKQK